MNDDPAHIERLRADLIRRARIERHGELDVQQTPAFPSLTRRPFLKLFRRGQPPTPARDAHRIDIESPKSPNDDEPSAPSRGLRFWGRSNSTRSLPPNPEMSQWNVPVTVPPSVASSQMPHYPTRHDRDAHHRTIESRLTRNTGSQRQRQPSQSDHHSSNSSQRQHKGGRRPKRFLFCFPWVKSRKARRQILTCFVSGLILLCMVAVYLGLSTTGNASSSEMTIMLVLVILFATIFFFHGLIRLSITLIRGNREEALNSRGAPQPHGLHRYAVPPHPIPVVLARDEEAAGVESTAANSRPPAYGLWRESVRVDPNRLFWQRNEAADPTPPRSTRNGPRPPSYASDDGVSYVVEARPRSIAPSADSSYSAHSNQPLPPHPMDVGRAS